MKNWTLKPLYYGKITCPKSVATPGRDADVILDVPYLGFLLQNGEKNILIDTGIDDDYIVDGKAWGGFPAEGGSDLVKQALSEKGLTPEDIDTIIFTHLHNDHAGNLSIFADSNPRMIFQKDEWKILLDPLPVMKVRGDYNPKVIQNLQKMNCLAIDGDLELIDGIKIIKTPGHTMGSQSIQVKTEKGRVVITGDHFVGYFMAWGQMDETVGIDGRRIRITPAPEIWGRFIPSTIIYDFYDFYDSSYKIIAHMEADKPEFMMPGHESSVLNIS